MPKKPTGLSPQASAHWDQVAPELVRLGLLTIVDGATFGAYCAAFASWQRAQRAVDKLTSLTVQRPAGPRPAPEIQIARAALADMERLGRQFRLSPESRRDEGLSAAGAQTSLEHRREAAEFFGPQRWQETRPGPAKITAFRKSAAKSGKERAT